ncbi:protein DOG1-like 3 [Juglans regia]|uniref:Protein DOG1-like 3 n=2 Tax=Juglans regia TaxID=51240 RepID=A0A2I4DTQ1_JUGRE|nr:protein DOG1-like 3 [Juglans regia]
MSFLPNVASSSLKTATPIMSLQLSNGGNDVASAIGNGSSTSESELLSFQRFFEHWIVEQNKNLQDLISASKHHEQANASNMAAKSKDRADRDEVRIIDKPHFCPLIDRVIQHYEQYYQAKSRCAKHDAIGVLRAPWTSALENAFMWIGGWRPSMAFHLLYSKSGQQAEEKLASFVQGMNSRGDLGDLSPSQLSKVDELQRRTIREEREITEKMAKHQETVADSAMVELSHAVTELIRSEGEGRRSGGIEKERVESVLALKEEGLEKILQRADDLRLRTLKAILDVFTPIQAVHFLIAAAELHLRLHDWGMKKDGTAGH